MFQDGYVRKDVFLAFIDESGCLFDDCIMDDENGVMTLFYFRLDMKRKVQITMPKGLDDIPKTTALEWLRELGIK